LRVLVCGGRDYHDRRTVDSILTQLHRVFGPIEFIVQGGADGADRWGAEWGRDNNIPVGTYNADWKKHGRAAGPIRNQKMLEEAKPDAVVAFPGGRGTGDMVSRARKAGIWVLEIRPS